MVGIDGPTIGRGMRTEKREDAMIEIACDRAAKKGIQP